MCFGSLAGSDDVPIVVRLIIFHGTAPRENDTFGAPASRIAGAGKGGGEEPGGSDMVDPNCIQDAGRIRSEEHTSELQSLMRISYAVFCLKKKKTTNKE